MHEGWVLLQNEGLMMLLKKTFDFLFNSDNRLFSYALNADYRKYLENDISIKRNVLPFPLTGAFSYQPKISIIVPVYNVAGVWLQKCIESVLAQRYQNWELCIYDDCSVNTSTLEVLNNDIYKDSRIKIRFGTVNQHIAAASNIAISMATGEYVGLLDNDDELNPDALFEVIRALNTDNSLDYIYTDEDKVESNGSHSFPYFKPSFNKILLYSNNYTCHFSVIRKSLGDSLGWFRKGYEGAQDYDLFLRITEATTNIHHIPKVLYHYRRIKGSTAEHFGAKSYAGLSGKRALESHFQSKSKDLTVESTDLPGIYTLSKVKTMPESITAAIHILPANRISLVNVKKTIAHLSSLGIRCETFTSSKQIHEIKRIFPEVHSLCDIRLWPEYIEQAAKLKSQYLLLIDSDIRMPFTESISQMLAYLQLDEVGAVCPKLIHDKLIYSSGIIKSTNDYIHLYQGINKAHSGYFGQLQCAQEIKLASLSFMILKSEILTNIDCSLNMNNTYEASECIARGIASTNTKLVLCAHASVETVCELDVPQTCRTIDINPNMYIRNNIPAIDLTCHE